MKRLKVILLLLMFLVGTSLSAPIPQKPKSYSKKVTKHSFEVCFGVFLLGATIISVLRNHVYISSEDFRSLPRQAFLLCVDTIPLFSFAITMLAYGSNGIDQARMEQYLEEIQSQQYKDSKVKTTKPGLFSPTP